MKNWSLILSIMLITTCIQILSGHPKASGPGDDIPEVVSPDKDFPKSWVYGFIEYLHDVHTPREYFMLLRVHPEAKIPNITGGFAMTDVYAEVRLRSVSTPRALNAAEERHRPHPYINQERARWNEAMQYFWNLMHPNKIFRVGNFKVLEDDKMLEADIEFMNGKAWLNLAQTFEYLK